MSIEVGSAYVRLRPNTSGFKSETEAGVRSGLAGVGKILAGAFAVGAAVEFGKKIVDAAESEQVAVTKAKRAIQSSNLGWFDHKKAIDATITSQARATGFMKHDLYDAFANMIRTTHSVNAALKLNAVAQDVARTRGLSLGAAQSLLARAYNGSFIGLKRLGIAITPVTTEQDKLTKGAAANLQAELIVAKAHGVRGFALTLLKQRLKEKYDAELAAAKAADKHATGEKAVSLIQQKFAGQAVAYAHTAAGAQDRFRESMQELEVEAGSKFLPTIANVANFLANSLPGALRTVGRDTEEVTGFFKEYSGEIVPIAGSILGLVVALKAYHTALRIGDALQRTYAAAQNGIKGIVTSTTALEAQATAAKQAENAATQELQISLNQLALAQGEVAAARNALNATASTGVASDTELAAANDAVTISEANLARATLAVTDARAGQVAATEAAATAQAELDVAMDANPVGALFAAIGLLTGALITLYQTSGTVRGVLNAIGSVFRDNSFDAKSAAKATEDYRTALDDLHHAAQSVVDANDRLADSKLQVREADAELTKLQREGKTHTLAYAEAQQRLREAHHGVTAAELALADAHKRRNEAVGKGNDAITKARSQLEKLTGDSKLIASFTHDAGKGADVFAKSVLALAKQAGGAKTPLGRAELAVAALAKQTGKVPDVSVWERFFTRLTAAPSKALQKSQNSVTVQGVRVGNVIGNSILLGYTQASVGSRLGQAISNSVNEAQTYAGDKHHGSGPFQDTIHKIGKPMGDGTIEGWVTSTKPLGTIMSQTVTDAIAQARVSLDQAIGEAKQNLASIGGSLASTVGDFFSAPQQRLQALQALKDAKQNLANVDVNGGTRDEVAAARAAVRAAQAEINRQFLTRRLADLSDELGRGSITKAAFNRDTDQLLAKLGISYKLLRKEMGIAFADQFRAEVQGLRNQATAIAAGPRRPDITGFEPQIIKPLDALKQGTKDVRDAVKQEGARQLAESKKQTGHLAKISKAAQQAADLAAAEKVLGLPSSANRSAGKARKR